MKPKTEKLFATLVRGKDYTLVNPATNKDKEFRQGEPVEITPEEKEWLQRHAVDRITVLAIETDEIIPITPGMNVDALGGSTSKDVQKFRFTTEATKAA